MNYTNAANYRWIIFLLLVFNYFNSQVYPVENLPRTTFHFDFEKFETQLKQSRSKSEQFSQLFIELPDEEGVKNVRFELKENKLTEQRLDNIITFDGVSADNTSSLKLSVFKNRINAIIKTNKGYFYIEPDKSNLKEYKIYGGNSEETNNFICGVGNEQDMLKELNSYNQNVVSKSTTNFPIGNQIRKFRMAVAATGEFTKGFNGVTDDALAAVVNVINLLNKIYESEVSITFSIILETTNKTLIFTDPDTDPFPASTTFPSAGNSQSGFNILNSNGLLLYNKYDIGHTFTIGTHAGGNAGPLPCNNTSKARAWTEWSTANGPLGSDVELTAHEIGHQFGAFHTYNATGGGNGGPTFCTNNWNSTSAVEPGAGVTRLSYSGNCWQPVDQTNKISNSFPQYFHAKSLDQILANLNASVSCNTIIASSNQPPLANAGADIIIPKNTPFKLNGTASDPNDTNLTYTWEQMDVATANDKGAFGSTITGVGGYTAVNSTTAPLFRSEPSNVTTERYFPKMKFVLGNQNIPPVNEAEALSMVPRNIKFRFTVRDNHSTNGGVDSDEIIVTVDNSGPLSVTYPNATGISIAVNSTVNITWDVNNTNLIKDNVNILLSIDGGNSFPYTLATGVTNNGNYTVSIPYIPATDKARIKIVGVINPNAEFFDVSDNNFTITSSCLAQNSYISPSSAVTAIAGSSAANLNMSAPQMVDDIFPAKTYVYNSDISQNKIVVFSSGAMTTPKLIGTYKSHKFNFRVSQSGKYILRYSPGQIDLWTAIHSGNPVSDGNFLTSNIYYSGSTANIKTNTKSVFLNEGVDYYSVSTNYSNPPNSTVFTITAAGPGQMYVTKPNPSGYNYVFVAINDSTGKITAVSNTANFTSLPIGNYTVKGLSYIDTVNSTTFVNKSISQLISSNICFSESINSRHLIITGALNTIDFQNIENDIKIAPNPVNDILYVITKNPITHYELYDFSGRSLVGKKRYSEAISFREYSAGSYTIVFYNGETRIYKTTIIKK
ncbi:reprolysin-like metallopeptidase [Chryseobacterium sp. OSA05B]|uniref:reprolysin-like metallopeptidase n=1 Tax=Chryseobacterium sp. OSA05B TaxID=2862650 RepID=UPI001CBCE047|nr:M12 family metallo-peptidase [Chryseobacterium sp. OSA05B]